MAFSPSKAKREKKEVPGIPLTSLMDAMTIILLFLLQQFNADGALVTAAEGLKLPESVSTVKPKKAVTVIAMADHIVVENDVVVTSEALQFNSTSEYTIPPLLDKLNAIADNLESLDAKLFTGELLLQADVNLEYKYFVRLVYTCAQAGFNKVKLVTVQLN